MMLSTLFAAFVLLLQLLLLIQAVSATSPTSTRRLPFFGGAVSRRRIVQPAFHPRGGTAAATASTTTAAEPTAPNPIPETISSSHDNDAPPNENNATPTTNVSENVLSSPPSLNATTTPTNNPIPSWKLDLPAPLQAKGNKTLQKLSLGSTDIYLLGTAHVSNDSSADVRLLLEAVEPDCIFVELCEARMALLEDDSIEYGDTNNNKNATSTADNNNNTTAIATKQETKQDFWDRLDSIRQSQGGSRLQALSTLLLTSVQEDYAETLGVELGGEFKAAHRYWKSQHDNDDAEMQTIPPSLVLGDRPLSLTLVRAWESLWWWPKTKVVAGLLWSSWHKPDPDEIRAWLESVLREETDVLTESLQELRQHFPTLYDTIIAERDAWLAAKLVQTCRVLTQQYQVQLQTLSYSKTSPPPPRKRLVAIVGAGHVPGIVQWLTSNNMSSTTTSPEAILRNLTSTKRWDKDQTVQTEMVPMWTNIVTQVQHNPDWSWADPSAPPVPP